MRQINSLRPCPFLHVLVTSLDKTLSLLSLFRIFSSKWLEQSKSPVFGEGVPTEAALETWTTDTWWKIYDSERAYYMYAFESFLDWISFLQHNCFGFAPVRFAIGFKFCVSVPSKSHMQNLYQSWHGHSRFHASDVSSIWAEFSWATFKIYLCRMGSCD